MTEGQANELLDVLRTLSDNVARLATAEIAVAGLLQRHETGEQVPTAYADMAGAVEHPRAILTPPGARFGHGQPRPAKMQPPAHRARERRAGRRRRCPDTISPAVRGEVDTTRTR